MDLKQFLNSNDLATKAEVVAAANGLQGSVADYATLTSIAPAVRTIGMWVVENDESGNNPKGSTFGSLYANDGVAYTYVIPYPWEADDLPTATSAFNNFLTAAHTDLQTVCDIIDLKLAVQKLEVAIDGNSTPITAGLKGYMEIPFNCEIVSAILLADVSTNTVIDIWKDTYANYPPTVADTITAAAKPTLSSAVQYKDTTLIGWTKTLNQGEILGFNVDSNNNATKLNIILNVSKR
jgi:hypothetical protein